MADRTQTIAHQRTRRDHSEETAQDYVEAIHQVALAKGECRAVDLSGRFGVSHVTVSRIVSRLVREGLAEAPQRKPIVLTERGRKMALESARRHEVVYRFLLSLGLDARTAAIDAEGIEHHVSRKTLRAFERAIDRT